MTEAQAIKHLEKSPYGGLEQLALSIYSKPKADRKTLFSAEPTKQAAMLNLPVEVAHALLNGPSFLAVAAPIGKRQAYNLAVQAEIDEVMLDRMLSDETQLPHIVKARQYYDEGTGITSPDGSSRVGVSIVVNQQFNYGGASERAGLQAADEAEDVFFNTLTAGDLPPPAVRDDAPTAKGNADRPLFLSREDR